MDYVIVCAAAVVIAVLTLFCGFGLGTLLMPVFAVFFDVEVAVAATAVVHLANNLFKLALVGRHADMPVALRFGLPALAGAAVGAWLLVELSRLDALATYELMGRTCEVTVVKLLVAVLIMGFAVFELRPAPGGERGARRAPSGLALAGGGVLSGVFGGLSGHQGALRSAFLIKLGMAPRVFVGTGVVIAVFVDVARLTVYGVLFLLAEKAIADGGTDEAEGLRVGLVVVATLAAFLGSFIGARLLEKTTLSALRKVVGAGLILMGLALAAGVV